MDPWIKDLVWNFHADNQGKKFSIRLPRQVKPKLYPCDIGLTMRSTDVPLIRRRWIEWMWRQSGCALLWDPRAWHRVQPVSTTTPVTPGKRHAILFYTLIRSSVTQYAVRHKHFSRCMLYLIIDVFYPLCRLLSRLLTISLFASLSFGEEYTVHNHRSLLFTGLLFAQKKKKNERTAWG